MKKKDAKIYREIIMHNPRVGCIINPPKNSVKGHLCDPKNCYMIKIVKNRGNTDTLTITILAKLHKVLVNPNAGWIIKAGTAPCKKRLKEERQRIRKSLGHHRKKFYSSTTQPENTVQ